MGRLDPVAFRTAFGAWATAALPILADEQIGLDGKTVRGSRDGAEGAIHLVSAFAGRARWVLAPQAVAEKANEITAIPEVLALLDRRGAVVSIDALGCQKAIAHAILTGAATLCWRSRTTIRPCAKTCGCGWITRRRQGG